MPITITLTDEEVFSLRMAIDTRRIELRKLAKKIPYSNHAWHWENKLDRTRLDLIDQMIGPRIIIDHTEVNVD